jgi:hypothetical protein
LSDTGTVDKSARLRTGGALLRKVLPTIKNTSYTLNSRHKSDKFPLPALNRLSAAFYLRLITDSSQRYEKIVENVASEKVVKELEAGAACMCLLPEDHESDAFKEERRKALYERSRTVTNALVSLHLEGRGATFSGVDEPLATVLLPYQEFTELEARAASTAAGSGSLKRPRDHADEDANSRETKRLSPHESKVEIPPPPSPADAIVSPLPATTLETLAVDMKDRLMQASTTEGLTFVDLLSYDDDHCSYLMRTIDNVVTIVLGLLQQEDDVHAKVTPEMVARAYRIHAYNSEARASLTPPSRPSSPCASPMSALSHDEIIAKVKGASDLDQFEQDILSCIVDVSYGPSTTFEDVCVAKEVVENLGTIIMLPLMYPAAFKKGILKTEAITGVLLYGT